MNYLPFVWRYGHVHLITHNCSSDCIHSVSVVSPDHRSSMAMAISKSKLALRSDCDTAASTWDKLHFLCLLLWQPINWKGFPCFMYHW